MFGFLFSPPESLSGGVSVAMWFGLFYVLFYLFDTASNVRLSVCLLLHRQYHHGGCEGGFIHSVSAGAIWRVGP
jgi:hypothetical protein